MNILFRVDASRVIGSGHVMRCLTLAKALRNREYVVSFICREQPGSLIELIEKEGFTVSRLPSRNVGDPSGEANGHNVWLGSSWEDDAEHTRELIEDLDSPPGWLVVDHYGLDRRWEAKLRPCVNRIMVIDDLAGRPHDCDLLLDQNLAARMHTRYEGKVPAGCVMLLGPRYAMLQPDYAELHRCARFKAGPLRRIFIFFGGADAHGLSGRSLTAILQLGQLATDVDLVLSAEGSQNSLIRAQSAGHGNIRLHESLPTLAPLMAQADIAIGAGGATTWERLSLGLPSLVVSVAENQRAIAVELNQQAFIRYLGHHDQVDSSMISEALREMLDRENDEAGWLRRWSIVDGLGTNRVCDAISGVPGC